MYHTKGIERTIPKEIIQKIFIDVLRFAKEQNGIDYLVVYKHRETGQVIFVIDQLTKEENLSGIYKKSDHYCTLLLGSEY